MKICLCANDYFGVQLMAHCRVRDNVNEGCNHSAAAEMNGLVVT